MMMQPAFGSGYYDSEVGPSSSYMHTHGHDVHEAPAEVPEQPDPPEQPRVQSRRRQPARNRRCPPCGTHLIFLLLLILVEKKNCCINIDTLFLY